MKWQNLRSNYRREKRKLEGRSVEDITWPYFSLMRFLDDHSKFLNKKGATEEGMIFNLDKDEPECIVLCDDDDDCSLVIDTSEAASRKEEDPLRLDIDSDVYNVDWDPDNRLGGDSKTSPDSILGKRRWKITDVEDYDRSNHIIKNVVTEMSDDEDNDDASEQSSHNIEPAPDDVSDHDSVFLNSLLPAMRELTPLKNVEFKEELLRLLKCKMVESSQSYCEQILST